MRTILGGALVASIAATVSIADAAQINISHAAFVTDNAAAPLRTGASTSNTSSSTLPFYASLPHNVSTTGFMVTVDVNNSQALATTCKVWSYNYDGTFLATLTASTPAAPGNWELIIPASAAQAPRWSYLTIQCDLRPHSWNVLWGANIQ